MSGDKDDLDLADVREPAPRLGRPRNADVEARKDEILAVAMSIFMQHGFATTMDSIAAAARMSKRTLYARYPDKLSLFEAVLTRLNSERTLAALSLPPDLPLTDALTRYAMALFDHYATPQVASFLRLMQMEQERFPHLDRVMREEVVRDQIMPLKTYFDAQPEGLLRPIDTMLAAKAVARMVIGEIADLYAVGSLPPADRFKVFALATADLFVASLRHDRSAQA